MPQTIRSVPGICDVERLGPTDRPADVLVELPHGATERAHYDAVAERLESELPDDLVAFFHVNTDVGSPEVGRAVADRLATRPTAEDVEAALGRAGRTAAPKRPLSVVLLRCLLPRTFVDVNRIVEPDPDHVGAFTPAVPPYVDAPSDRRLLVDMHRRYHEIAKAAWDEACGHGGFALALHTYAPRSVGIDTVDHDIVAALRRAYAPRVYETWPKRPEVDLLVRGSDGEPLASCELADDVEALMRAAGFEVARNATYHLHPATTGYHLAATYADRALTLEIDRGCLADPFVPFEPMTIPPARAARAAAPIAAACLLAASRRAHAPLRVE